MTNFDPNGAAAKNSGIYGINYSLDDSLFVLLPISWDATSSLKSGSADFWMNLLEASMYQELFDIPNGKNYDKGIFMSEIEGSLKQVKKINKKAKRLTKSIIKKGGVNLTEKERKNLEKINNFSLEMNRIVYEETNKYLESNKTPIIIGGDHSVSLGSIKAYSEKFPKLGLLQIDAHADLRTSFESFKYSHGSIISNIESEIPLQSITQVGIRALCEEEFNKINTSKRINVFFDQDIQQQKSEGLRWSEICKPIISSLPMEVYLTLDVDGLEYSLCQNTGTPVPGGLSYYELIFLIEAIVKSGRKIVGFDVVEAISNNNNWDAIVVSQIIYKLIGYIK